jgi:hypothetical protein
MAGKTANLYLQIGANLDAYTTALKAGKVSLTEFAGDVEKQIDGVNSYFEKLGGGNVAETARSMEAAFKTSFGNIRAAAEQALTLPKTDAGAISINLLGAEQALTDAENLAIVYRELAAAAASVVIGNDNASDAEKRTALAAAAGVTAQEEKIVAIRQEVAALRSLQGALDAAGVSSVEAADDEDAVVGAHNRMGASGLIAEHVVRSFSDSITAGQSPVRAFALELPRITEAMQFLAAESNATEGALGKFAGFMSSGWGLAITLGVSILAPLVTGLLDTGHAADTAKQAEQEYGQFQADLANFIDTANGKLRDRLRLLAQVAVQENQSKIAEQYGQVTTARDQAFSLVRTAAAGGATAQAAGTLTEAGGVGPVQTDPDIQKAIDSAGVSIVKLRDNLNSLAKVRPDLQGLAEDVNKLAGQAAFANDKANALRGVTGDLSIALAGGVVETSALIDRRVAEATATTAVEKAQARLNDVKAEGAEIDKMAAGADKAAALKSYEQDLLSATNSLKQAQAAAKAVAADKQVGRDITLEQAEQIVTSIGGQITSTYRTTAEQAALYANYQAGTGPLAAKPGTSLHERGQAIDVAKRPGISLGVLKQAFAAQGVHLTEALDEGNHYHVGFGPKGPSADTLARRQQGAVVKGANDDRSYQAELGSAQDAYAKAQLALSDMAEGRLKVETDELQAGLQQRLLEINDQVTAKKITSTEADKLKALVVSTEALQEEAARRKEQSALIDAQLQHDELQLQGAASILNLMSELATTTKQRRDLALQLLANEEQQARTTAQAELRQAIISVDHNKQSDAQTKLDQIDQQHGLKVEQINRQYASPGQKYLQTLNGTSIDDSLQQIGVDGLDKLGDEIQGVVTGTKSISEAFHDMATSVIADILKIGIQQELIKPLANSLFGGSSGLLGGLFGGGGANQFAGVDAQAESGITGFLSGFHLADGGHVLGAGSGRSDSIPAMLSNGEFVVNASATSKHLPLLHALNDNRIAAFADGGMVGSSLSIPAPRDLSPADIREISQPRGGSGAPIHFHLEGSVLTQELVDQMNEIGNHAAMRGAAGGASLAADQAARKRRRSLA